MLFIVLLLNFNNLAIGQSNNLTILNISENETGSIKCKWRFYR